MLISLSMPLQLGLNVKKSGNVSSKNQASSRTVAFGGDSDSEPEANSKNKQNGSSVNAFESQQITYFDDEAPTSRLQAPSRSSKSSQRPTSPPKLKPRNSTVASAPSLSSTRAANKITTDAEAQDSTIFDYDAHFSTSSSSALAAQRRAQSQKEAAERKPKYMTNMQAAASQRKRDYLRAEDKKLQREREDDSAGETEAFVTGAYKERQDEVRRLEAEEKEKERKEEENRGKGGMGGFWKGVWDEDEKRRTELAQGGEGESADVEDVLEKDKELADKARQLNEHGANIQINEEGVVADKRQLLTAGLNVASKSQGANSVPEKERTHAERKDDSKNEWDSRERREARRAMGERHARMVEQQMEEARKRKVEEEVAELQKREMANKSKKTGQDISSAKERYLQRKREAEDRKKFGLED